MRIVRSHRWCLIVVVPLVAVVIAFQIKRSTGPASGTMFDGSVVQAFTRPSFMVGTFNIDGGQGTDGVVDLKRTASCVAPVDYLGLNEVHGFLLATPRNQAIAIADRLNRPYLFVPAERTLLNDSFGNAVYSRLPVVQWERVVLPSRPFAAKRNYLHATVQFRQQRIQMFTTHTDWKAGGEEQLRIVIEAFLAAPAPAVLMGDLNVPASSPQIKRLQRTPGVEDPITEFLDHIPGRVDWIFLRGLTATNAGPVEMKASDHPAYWALVQLKPPAPTTAKATTSSSASRESN